MKKNPAPKEPRGLWKEVSLAELRKRHGTQPRLSVLGHARKDHGDMIAGVLAARAGNDHARAMNLAPVPGGLERHGHFGPCRERVSTAKFDSVFMKDNCISR